jgi:hypothetical protein
VDIRLARARREAAKFLDEIRLDYETPDEALHLVSDLITYDDPDFSPPNPAARALSREKVLVELILQLKIERLL